MRTTVVSIVVLILSRYYAPMMPDVISPKHLWTNFFGRFLARGSPMLCNQNLPARRISPTDS
jgi:hypothetical protein